MSENQNLVSIFKPLLSLGNLQGVLGFEQHKTRTNSGGYFVAELRYLYGITNVNSTSSTYYATIMLTSEHYCNQHESFTELMNTVQNDRIRYYILIKYNYHVIKMCAHRRFLSSMKLRTRTSSDYFYLHPTFHLLPLIPVGRFCSNKGVTYI